jgi:hypothetical protein
MVLDESGYTAALQAEKSAEAAGRLENLTELARAMEDYEDLGGFLEHVSLVMDNDANEDTPKVTIMTIHGAKGLEFDQVFLPGWEEGVFPSQRSLDEGGLASLEEERRLAYVAITRARRKCTILHAANRRIYGQWTSSIPSRFVAELPKAHVSRNRACQAAPACGAQWSERDDPFAHVARDKPERQQGRGPGWQRAATQTYDATPRRCRTHAQRGQLAAKPRLDIRAGDRVTHDKFGEGIVAAQDGNRLEIDFDAVGASACWTASCARRAEHKRGEGFPSRPHNVFPAIIQRRSPANRDRTIPSPGFGGLVNPAPKARTTAVIRRLSAAVILPRGRRSSRWDSRGLAHGGLGHAGRRLTHGAVANGLFGADLFTRRFSLATRLALAGLLSAAGFSARACSRFSRTGLSFIAAQIDLELGDLAAGQLLDIGDRLGILARIEREGAARAPPRPVRPMRWT